MFQGNNNSVYKLFNAQACPDATAITSDKECKAAIIEIGQTYKYFGVDSFAMLPMGCFCYPSIVGAKDGRIGCYLNTNKKEGKEVLEKESTFVVCAKYSLSLSSWVYPDAAILDSSGKSDRTSFVSRGEGACQDTNGNLYPGNTSSNVASPTACRDFCLDVGFTDFLVGFHWRSGDNTCKCAIDALSYGSTSGTGRMGDPDGQAGSSCFERRYAIVPGQS